MRPLSHARKANILLKRPLPLNFRCLSEEQRKSRPRSPFSSSLGPCPQDGLNWASPKAGPAFHRALCVYVGGAPVWKELRGSQWQPRPPLCHRSQRSDLSAP